MEFTSSGWAVGIIAISAIVVIILIRKINKPKVEPKE